LDSVFNRKDEVIEMVKSRFIKELVEPLEEKINEIVANRDKREKDIQDTQDKLSRLKEEKSEIEKQFEEIQQLGIE
jgi:chromosome segregation ATPase